MSTLIVILRSGERREITAPDAGSVKEAILAAGIDEVHAITNCGGCCSCGTCHVIFEEAVVDRLLGPQMCEEDLLEIVTGREPGSRLACQVPFTSALDGASVRIGPEP